MEVSMVYEPISRRYFVPGDYRIDIRPGAVNSLPSYRDMDDYVQAVVEARVPLKNKPPA